MEFRHVPVLFDECMDILNIRPNGIYVDGTLGGGGHSEGILKRLSEDGTLIGIDRDRDALNAAEERLKPYRANKIFLQGSFGDIKSLLNQLGVPKIDGALLDIGVSSFQLDNPERGFSYMHDAPLDMRMDTRAKFTAEDVVNEYSEEELADIIKRYGEERWAKRIAQFIVRAREMEPIERTGQLTDIIKAAIPAKARRTGPHPAKRTFQAIRIEVNDELGQIERAVDDFCDVLAPEGRFAVITFHSLEDRIVKQGFQRRERPCTCPPELPVCVCGKVGDVKRINRKPIVAGKEELERNPRSRSAKLRGVRKLKPEEMEVPRGTVGRKLPAGL